MALETTKILKNKIEINIRSAAESDLVAINDIYNYYVLNSTCTYQIKPETIEDRFAWFNEHNEDYPIIVAESSNTLFGWASISKFRSREGYNPTVEISIYIRHDKLFNGTGSCLLEELIVISKNTGYHSIIAGISSDQEASIKLHEKFCFKKAAHLNEAGFKFDKWLDVVYYQLML